MGAKKTLKRLLFMVLPLLALLMLPLVAYAKITEPTDGALVSGTISVSEGGSCSSSPGHRFLYRPADGEWTVFGGWGASPRTVNWDTTTVPDGRYYIRSLCCTADDIYFCWTIDTITVQVSNPAPVPVGGYILPVSRLELLPPWLGLAALMAMAARRW